MVDEVQVVPRCDGHGPTSPLHQPGVGLVQGMVHVHEGVDDGLTVSGRLWHLGEHGREESGTHILQEHTDKHTVTGTTHGNDHQG